MMQAITITDLSKAYGDQQVLRGISMQAAHGDVVALMGSSGSGKSTLLRCINQLEQPDAGTIEVAGICMAFGVGGKPIRQKAKIQVRTKAGMVFQQFNLWAHLTILENLITAPKHVLSMPHADAVEQAKILLTKVGIADKLYQYPAQLSGGQQQRVAIARALMMKPEVMLFDEPTSALDPEMVSEVLQVMQALAAEGMTMIVASHEIGFVREVATHAIFLHEGKILEQGSAAELFNQAKTERFKKFLESVRH